MPFQECSYVFAEGRKCGSPALRGGVCCYYHARALPAPGAAAIQLSPGPLKGAAAIRHARSEVRAGLASGKLDANRAAILLYGLRIALDLANETWAQAGGCSQPGGAEPLAHTL